METKYCKHCQKDHPLTKEFWYKENDYPVCRIQKNTQTLEYYYKNKEKCLATHKRRRQDPEVRAKHTEWKRKWRQKNKQKKVRTVSARSVRRRDSELRRYLKDPGARIKKRLRSQVPLAVRGRCKDSYFWSLVDCSPEFFRHMLQVSWYPGMSWDNYGYGEGKWVVDHKWPLAFYDHNDPDDLDQAWHWSNMRAMWWADNHRKRDSAPEL